MFIVDLFYAVYGALRFNFCFVYSACKVPPWVFFRRLRRFSSQCGGLSQVASSFHTWDNLVGTGKGLYHVGRLQLGCNVKNGSSPPDGLLYKVDSLETMKLSDYLKEQENKMIVLNFGSYT